MVLTPIKKVLPQTIKKAGIDRQVQASMVLETFSLVVKEVLGQKFAKKIKPMHFKNKILTVACLSSVLAQELQLNQKKVIKAINKKFDKKMVEKLRFLS